MPGEEGFDIELGVGGPEGQLEPAPDPAAGAATPAAASDDFVEFQVKDEDFRVTKTRFQEMADEMGMSVDELKETLQIGRDGRNIYRSIAEERRRISEAWETINAERARPQHPGAPAREPAHAPTAATARSRPPVEDINGQVLWLGDTIERILPVLERLPTIEETVNRSVTMSEDGARNLEISRERAISTAAYNEVAANWEREGFGKLPPKTVLEERLRRFPISDDVDMTWHEIWDAVGWMESGSRVARMQRRRQVLDAQTPRTAAPIPAAHRGGPAPIPAPVPASPGGSGGPRTNEELLAEARMLEQKLSGITVADVAPHLSRR